MATRYFCDRCNIEETFLKRVESHVYLSKTGKFYIYDKFVCNVALCDSCYKEIEQECMQKSKKDNNYNTIQNIINFFKKWKKERN